MERSVPLKATGGRTGTTSMRFWHVAVIAATFLVAVAVSAGSAYASSPPPSNYSNGFEANTNGWYGSVNRDMTGSSGYAYANGIAAEAGNWYARPSCNGSGCGPFTDWGTNFTATSFPPNGFTTSLDIYLDMSYAAANRDSRFDWERPSTTTRATPPRTTSSTPVQAPAGGPGGPASWSTRARTPGVAAAIRRIPARARRISAATRVVSR